MCVGGDLWVSLVTYELCEHGYSNLSPDLWSFLSFYSSLPLDFKSLPFILLMVSHRSHKLSSVLSFFWFSSDYIIPRFLSYNSDYFFCLIHSAVHVLYCISHLHISYYSFHSLYSQFQTFWLILFFYDFYLLNFYFILFMYCSLISLNCHSVFSCT